MNTNKYQIGYTTGVFDLFHIGHLNILRESKKRCEFLIVGVSSDEVVVSYKHKMPVIPFVERIAIIESIKYVDMVVVQSTMDKLEAWRRLKFNVVFHGDDWKGSKLYDQYIQEFARVGVDVIFLPHTQGTSSTELSKKIMDCVEL